MLTLLLLFLFFYTKTMKQDYFSTVLKRQDFEQLHLTTSLFIMLFKIVLCIVTITGKISPWRQKMNGKTFFQETNDIAFPFNRPEAIRDKKSKMIAVNT